MVSTALVTIFVDMENVGGQFIRSVADFGATQGRVCHLAVYGDWRRGYGQHWDTTLDVGGVPRQILRTGGKNSADIAIVVDVMEFLSLSPDVQVYILATGDSDFVPLAHKLRQRGKVVIGVAPEGRSVADTLVAACDRFERLGPDRGSKTDGAPLAGPAQPPLTDSGELAEGDPEAAPGPARPPAGLRPPSIEQVRALLTELLRQRGPMTTGAIGNLLQQTMPGFRHRALGHRTLSDLLRAQADLLEVVPTAHELRVTLLPGAVTPIGEDAAPYPPEAAQATGGGANTSASAEAGRRRKRPRRSAHGATAAEAADRDGVALPQDGDAPAEFAAQAEPWEPFFGDLPAPATAADEAASSEAVPEGAAPDEPAPNEAVPDEAAPDEAAPREGTPAGLPLDWPAAEPRAAINVTALGAAAPPVAAASAELLWPALLRHLGGIELASYPAARAQLALAELLSLPAEGRAEATRRRAVDAGIPLAARRAGWLADCAGALQELGGEAALLDRLDQLEYPAQQALLRALPGVGPATAEAVLRAVHPLADPPGAQNLLLF